MVRCTVIETSGLRKGICDLCDHHCERDVEGMGHLFPCDLEPDGCGFYQRAYYIKPLEPNLGRGDQVRNTKNAS